MAGSLFNILSLLGSKDSTGNTALDYAKSYSKAGGDFNNPDKQLSSNIDTSKALGAGLLNMGANAAKNNAVSSIPGGMVSGFYVPGQVVKRSPLSTALGYINDMAKGAIGSVQSQSDDISKAKTFGGALGLQQKQRQEDEALDLAKSNIVANTKVETANANNKVKNDIADKKIEANKPIQNLKAESAQSVIDKNKQQATLKQQQMDNAITDVDAKVKKLTSTMGDLKKNFDLLPDDYFGGGWNRVHRAFSHLSTEQSSAYSAIQQRKYAEIAAFLPQGSRPNMQMEKWTSQSLLDPGTSKNENMKNIADQSRYVLNSLSDAYRKSHPNETKALEDSINNFYQEAQQAPAVAQPAVKGLGENDFLAKTKGR